jgi:hypothetical protein
MIRLIQYLPLVDVEALIRAAHAGMSTGGVLFLNYTVSGGVHDIDSVKVPKFSHPFETVKGHILALGMEILHATEADMPPSNTSLNSGSIHACDLVALKLEQDH